MEKKIYSEPVMAVELFTPNQFVAACGDDWIPATQLGKNFWADVVHDGGYAGYSYGPDGIINSSNAEFFNAGHAPNGGTGFDANLLRGHWFENMTLYKKVSTSIPSGSRYTNTNYMVPMSGYENVAIYITQGGVSKVWIYTGNNGNKPTNPDWQDPGQTINMS
ncbi:MAG: hypothetical protein IKH95_01910 [Bacteroidaceae bacterium]|nr:hypothetical protein [Bacteroidaceae bacterium]